AHGYAHAMMDLSDGLASDLPRLATASGCGFELNPDLLPRTRGCNTNEAMSDGEDYELLFAVPPRLSDRLRRGWMETFPRLRLTEIGSLREPGISASALPQGFDHFFHCQQPRERAS
ncbi:MAG: AIR synthase-related protein, partial [Terrimicrobiaceae bacterium]